MLFSSKMSPSLVPPIYYGNIRPQQVQLHTHLGIILTPTLSWSKHIPAARGKANWRIGVLKRYKYIYSRKYLEIWYILFVRPILKYCDVLYGSCSLDNSYKLEKVQLETAHIVTGCNAPFTQDEDCPAKGRDGPITTYHW